MIICKVFWSTLLATSIDQEWEGAKINLMTMHAAKGLEFEVVFLPVGKKDCFLIKNPWKKKEILL